MSILEQTQLNSAATQSPLAAPGSEGPGHAPPGTRPGDGSAAGDTLPGEGGAPHAAAQVLSYWGEVPSNESRRKQAPRGQRPPAVACAVPAEPHLFGQGGLNTASNFDTGLTDSTENGPAAGQRDEAWAQLGARGQGPGSSEALLARMSASLGMDLRDVRLIPASHDETVRAGHAVATRDEVRYDPARVDLNSPAGLQVLGHELAHVVQQRRGSQRADAVDAGLTDSGGESSGASESAARRAQLESEADAASDRAVQGQQAHIAAGAVTPMQQFQNTVDVLSWPKVLADASASADTKKAICSQIETNRSKTPVSMLHARGSGNMYNGKNPARPKKQVAIEKQDKKSDADRVKLIISKELEGEGGYSSINTYDNQKFTFGRGFAVGGGLPKVMKQLFADPALSAAFLRCGINFASALEVVDTKSQTILTAAAAVNELQSNKQLQGVFVEIAEDTSAAPGEDSSAQKVADAQWDALESTAFNAPSFVYSWKEDRLIALAAHLVHWLPKVKWSHYESASDVAGVLDAWLANIGIVNGITRKTDSGAYIISDSATNNIMNAFGGKIAGEHIRSRCPYPIPYTASKLKEDASLSGKYLFSHAGGGDGYYVYPDMPALVDSAGKSVDKQLSDDPIYQYFHQLNGLSMHDVLGKLHHRSQSELAELRDAYKFDDQLGTRSRAALRAALLHPKSAEDVIKVDDDPDFAKLSDADKKELKTFMEKKVPKASPSKK